MAHASFGPLIWDDYTGRCGNTGVVPARLILGGIRKEKTMNPADRDFGMDRSISLSGVKSSAVRCPCPSDRDQAADLRRSAGRCAWQAKVALGADGVPK